MSVWGRVRALLGWDRVDRRGEGGAVPTAAQAEAPSDPAGGGPADAAAAALVAIAVRRGSGADDEQAAIEAFERLLAQDRTLEAIELARRVLAASEMPRLRCRLAERLDARGDETGARTILEPLVQAVDAPLEGWMLAAEIAERHGDVREAVALYERVLARDVAYPRARERIARLREREDPRRADAGATLLGEGALAHGRYRLLRELGRGGAGTVFLAEDRELGRRVALKVYHRRGRADRERLLHEARMAAAIEHPGVIRILDVDETQGAIAMELLPGGSIRSALGAGPVPRARVLQWSRGLVAALRFVHARGVVHRDLKPSNVLLGEGDRVVLTDFGIAAPIGQQGPQAAGEGTLAYMPPEQRAGAPADPSMDVHALGATLREMLGRGQGEAPPLAALAAACLSAEPRARPSLDELQTILDELQAMLDEPKATLEGAGG